MEVQAVDEGSTVAAAAGIVHTALDVAVVADKVAVADTVVVVAAAGKDTASYCGSWLRDDLIRRPSSGGQCKSGSSSHRIADLQVEI